jgi:hypothetical protein
MGSVAAVGVAVGVAAAGAALQLEAQTTRGMRASLRVP